MLSYYHVLYTGGWWVELTPSSTLCYKYLKISQKKCHEQNTFKLIPEIQIECTICTQNQTREYFWKSVLNINETTVFVHLKAIVRCVLRRYLKSTAPKSMHISTWFYILGIYEFFNLVLHYYRLQHFPNCDSGLRFYRSSVDSALTITIYFSNHLDRAFKIYVVQYFFLNFFGCYFVLPKLYQAT